MSNPIDDGGGAFPFYDVCEGMSLRDYFAAKALNGILAEPAGTQLSDHAKQNPSIAAEWAYQFADAMLAERNKSK